MKGFLEEFKAFINRGSVMDMAVGIIIGGAFTAIVTSLTDDIVKPFIMLVTGGNGTSVSVLTIPVPGTENGIDFSSFISAIINFLIIALVVFLLVKALNSLHKSSKNALRKNDGSALEEVPPICPFCLEEIKEDATRCPHCTEVLPEPAKPTYKKI